MDEKEPHTFDTLDWQATIALEKFAAIDQDFVTFRRFEKLQRYNLLHLHQQLTDCLEVIIKEEEERRPEYTRIRDTVLKAAPLLKEYNAALLDYQNVHQLPGTPGYIKRTIQNLMAEHPRYWFLGAQYGLPSDKADLCSLPTPHKGYIHQLLDEYPTTLWGWMPKSSCKRSTNGIVQYSEEFLRRIEYIIITVLGMMLLAAPISVLFISGKGQKALVVFGCLIVAMALSSLLTDPIQKNRLTFMVAYGAFLVALFQPGN